MWYLYGLYVSTTLSYLKKNLYILVSRLEGSTTRSNCTSHATSYKQTVPHKKISNEVVVFHPLHHVQPYKHQETSWITGTFQPLNHLPANSTSSRLQPVDRVGVHKAFVQPRRKTTLDGHVWLDRNRIIHECHGAAIITFERLRVKMLKFQCLESRSKQTNCIKFMKNPSTKLPNS